MPIANDQPCFAPKRRDRVDSRRIALRSKDDRASVGRNVRFMIIGWIVSETARFTSREELHPDVGVTLSCAVRGVGQQLAVPRDYGL